ncbi:NACHT domain-containing protein [Vibrio alginolyticus]|uniref:NACHT domain-containing protein n=1 Tax=Vibrio alginolyticus TaxID=663 RepID=UPI0006D1A684|nr:NACHT domain-containing protein [Vibrio alginolyticus]MBS9978270.1 NACHT domain-containing protein [Vibrio alginolyticus]MCQ9036829.1 NACHT domain-containing protein [Vibrio alginolyticus]
MAFEEKLALEAAKPAIGLVSALIGPKIEKLRKWVEGRELKSQLNPDMLSETLDSYLNSLASRVSVISSICFPQKEFSIERAYEPLFIEEIHTYDDKKLSVEKIVNNIEKSCLIIDSAGMGKSTFSKYIISQVLYKSDRIPILFELRKSKQDIELLESIARELDPLGKVFSREIFYELIKEGKFVIVLDGFDEVEFERQSDVAEQINEISVKGKRNSLILTTRPQELVPNILNSHSYKFSAFTLEQAKKLILRLDDISGLNIGERLVLQLRSVPNDFLENPLLVSLLYSTFGTTNTIADRVCTFYSDIYHALYKGHDLINKNGFQREKISCLDYEQFRILLRALCFQMTLKRKASFSSLGEAYDYINNAIRLSKIEPKSTNKFLHDLMNAVPLIQKDGNEFKFLHKTIIEYFAAEYIVYKPDSEEILNKMFHSKSFRAFEKVFDFVYELSPVTYDNVVTKHHALNIIENSDLSSVKKSILHTSAYLCDLKIGFFSVDKYRDKSNKNKGDRPDYSKINTGSSKYNGYSWSVFELSGTKYFLIMCAKSRDINIHGAAWYQITEEYSVTDEILEETIGDLTELANLIGFNSLYDVTSKINELSKFEIASSLATNYIGGLLLTPNLGERKLSEHKIHKFLNSLNAQVEMEDELSGLLDR